MFYDEDLHENHFFKALVETNNALYSKAADNKWLICVPRSDTVSKLKLNRNDFESHVLLPHSDDGASYRSVNNKVVVISSAVITTGEGYKDSRKVKILFVETFFNQRDESYRVLCLEQPLEGAILDEPVTVSLESLDDCMKFLWSDLNTHRTRKRIDGLIDHFSAMDQEYSKNKTQRIAVLVDICKAFYAHAVQFAMRDGNIKRLVHGSGTLKNALSLSIETYVMSKVHSKVFKEVCIQRSGQDADLNVITRKLSDISPQQLGVKESYLTNLAAVTDKLSSLNNCHTPLEKLVCIREAISRLHDPSAKSSEAMAADELLSIFTYLIITCDIPNWYGNIIFIKGFSLSSCASEDQIYLLTSLEAALQYMSSDQLLAGTPNREKGGQLEDSMQSHFLIWSDSIQPACEEKSEVELFFESIIKNDIAKVKAMLNRVQSNVDFSDFCHPLCECDRCVAIKEQQNEGDDETDSVTVYSRGEHGRTGLHHAARKGHVDVIEALLDNGSSVMAPDNCGSTPLHLACHKGHQRAALLLLANGADSNSTDHRGNTALHLACSYGHTECVQALLFHNGPAMCNLNIANDVGDTALHNAARWGYGAIVSLLLEHRANPMLTNKTNETPLQCAYSRKVRDILLPVVHPATARDRRHLTVSGHSTSYEKTKLRHTSESAIVANRSNSVLDRSKSVSSNALLQHQPPAPPTSPVYQVKLDRSVKKLLKAGIDGDLGMVKHLLHWNQQAKHSNDDVARSAVATVTCHPLCDCDNCVRMKLNENSCGSDGFMLLHQACLHGHRRLVELLVEHNADINAVTTEDKHTPLHFVCQYNHKDIVLLLLEHKVKLNPQDVHLNTPLHFCCNNGHMESATLLMIHGADVNLANERGDTPLHNAAKWNHSELVHELLLYGAQFMAVNGQGMTPYDLTKSEDCKITLLAAREGQIQVGIHATKPGDIGQFSSPHKFDSSPIVPCRGNHDDVVSSPKSDTGSWDVIDYGSPSIRKRGNSTSSGVSNIFKDIESYDRSISLEK